MRLNGVKMERKYLPPGTQTTYLSCQCKHTRDSYAGLIRRYRKRSAVRSDKTETASHHTWYMYI